MSDEFNEVSAAVDGLMTAFDEFRADHNRRLEKVEIRLARPGLTATPERANTVENKAWTNFLRRGREAMEDFSEIKSLVVSDETAGGYLAPAEFVAQVLKVVTQFSPLRQAATVGTTSAGSVILPKRTAIPTGYWVGETEDRTATQPSYGQLEIPVSEAACYVDVSQRLLEDAAVDVAQEVARDLAEEFGRLEGQAFINGDAVKKPWGVMADPNVGFVVNGHATAVQSDALINLVYALPPYYRNRSAWLMNSSTLAAARKLKDGQNNYLWQPSYQLGQPETLLGRPVIETVDMPDIASGSFPIAYGDWATAYRIYDKPNGFSVLRDPYSVATKGLVRFHARRRVGGQVVLHEAAKKLKMSTS
jgi:HK97 family phage major capsid protein